MTQLNFDATNIPHDLGYEIVPAGWYEVMIDESEMKPTKDGSGVFLQLRFNVISGQYANRKIFTRINLRNANPVAQEIAYKQLSAICHAVGILQVADSSQLHGIPLKVKVKVRKDTSGQYEDQNDITAFKNINEIVEGAPTPRPPAFPAPQPPATQPPAFSAPAPTFNTAPAPVPFASIPPTQPLPQTQPWAPQAAPQAAPQTSETQVPPWMQQPQ